MIKPVRSVLIGAGGHGRVVLDTMRSAGHPLPECALDAAKVGSALDGVPVIGSDENLKSVRVDGVDHFILGIGGLGTSFLRQKIWQKALDAGFLPLSVIHPSAQVSGLAIIGPGCQILAATVINAGTVIGAGVIVNTGCVVEHDCEVGNFCHLAPQSCLGGGVKLGDHCHIGLGAVVREYKTIGASVLIGMGAAVVSDIPPGAVAMGIPARIINEKSKN